MRGAIKMLAGGFVAAVLVVGGTTSAQAHNNGYGSGPNYYAADTVVTGSAVNNGNFQYGVHTFLDGSNKGNDSSYYHGSLKHRASVKNSTGTVVRSADRNGGLWAQATQPGTAGGNQAFWFTY